MDIQNVQMHIEDAIAASTNQVEELRADVEFKVDEIVTEVKDLQENCTNCNLSSSLLPRSASTIRRMLIAKSRKPTSSGP